jgi:hypothetical protein
MGSKEKEMPPASRNRRRNFMSLAKAAVVGVGAEDGLGAARVLSGGASMLVLPDHVTAKSFPRLAALTERAMKIDAFASTVPHL